MTLQTNPASRREMVQAISERLNSPAVYLRMPACAYRIGELTVERDGSIVPFLPDTLITRFFAVSRQKEHSGTIVCSLWSGRGL